MQSWSELIFEGENPDDNEYISEDLVSLRRDTHERQIMAKLAKKESAPLVTLTDGPLELYHEPRGEKSFEKYFKEYLAALDDLLQRRIKPALAQLASPVLARP